MRRVLTALIILASSLPAISQFPIWKIKANNDTIYIMEGSSIIRGERGGKTTLWNLDGKQLYTTGDRINKLHEGRATVLNKESWEIIGFIDTDGNYTSLPHISVVYNSPHFEDGFLLGKRKGKYIMYSNDGKEQPLPELTAAYPFSNGYAVYMAYENPEKQKKPFYNYLKADGTPLEKFNLKENGKEKILEPKNIRFLSAVDKDGRSIAIIKNKLYLFNAADESLTPILKGDESEKKRNLTLIENKELDFTAITDANFGFNAKYGKDETEEYEFDNRLRLLQGGKPNITEKTTIDNKMDNIKTALTSYQEKGAFGLIYDGEDSIPCQFEQIGLKYDNNAFVKNKGKWGVLTLIPDLEFDITLNNGDTITFRHQNFPTKLHINFPCSIPSKRIRTDIADMERIRIDLDSKENRDTRTGNYINYDCVLTVPTDLTDSVANIKFGPLELIHDNVRLRPIYLQAKANYKNPYSIEIPNKGLNIDQGNTDFNISVYMDKEDGENEYPYNVNVASEALMARIDKVSDNNYKCTVEYVEEGLHDLDIILTENGCPRSVFPMEIVCAKKGIASIGPRHPEMALKNDTIAINQNAENKDVKKNGTKNSVRIPASLQKAPLFIKYEDGYFVGEVTDQNSKLHSGPGDDFPAPTYTIDNIGQNEIPAPYTGQLIKVKEEGDFYLKYPSVPTSQQPQPEYISKKSVKPVRSRTFNLKEIIEPLIYVSSHEIFDEANNKGQYIDEILIYPGGLCIEYSEGKMGSLIKFGNIADGKPAIEWKYRIQTIDNGETQEGSKTNITPDNSQSMHRLRLTVGPQDKKTITEGKNEMGYYDLSVIGEQVWVGILKDYLLTADPTYDKHEVTKYECDILTKDMLEKKYTKVKK